MPFTENLAVFFNTGPTGAPGNVEAQYTHDDDDPVPVNGLFDRDYVDVYDAENSGPRFACELADMPNVVHGDELEITTADFGEETYIVRTVKKDGLGVVALKLELQDG